MFMKCEWKKLHQIVVPFVYHSSNINELILSLSLVDGKKKTEKEKIMSVLIDVTQDCRGRLRGNMVH